MTDTCDTCDATLAQFEGPDDDGGPICRACHEAGIIGRLIRSF